MSQNHDTLSSTHAWQISQSCWQWSTLISYTCISRGLIWFKTLKTTNCGLCTDAGSMTWLFFSFCFSQQSFLYQFMTPSDVGMVVQPFVTGSYSIQANKQPGRQTERHTRTDTDRQPDRPDTDRQTNRHTHTLTDRQPERQTGLHTDRQPDRQMSRQTNTSI